MKRGWKIFWIICGSAFALGLVLCITGKAMGEVTMEGIAKAYKNDIHIKRSMIYAFNDWDDDDNDYYDDDYDGYEKADNIPARGEGISNFTGIRELDVDVKALEVIVKQGDGDDIRVDISHMDKRLQKDLEFENEDGELSIETTDNSFFDNIRRSKAGRIIIELPKNNTIKDASFKIGAGKLTIEALNAGNLNIDVGAGEVIARQFTVKDLEVDCSAGSGEFNGSVTNNADISCGIGKINMTLAESRKDYNYELKCGLGKLKIGRDEYSGHESKKRIDNGTHRKMKIECGVGEVTVSFKDTK